MATAAEGGGVTITGSNFISREKASGSSGRAAVFVTEKKYGKNRKAGHKLSSMVVVVNIWFDRADIETSSKYIEKDLFVQLLIR